MGFSGQIFAAFAAKSSSRFRWSTPSLQLTALPSGFVLAGLACSWFQPGGSSFPVLRSDSFCSMRKPQPWPPPPLARFRWDAVPPCLCEWLQCHQALFRRGCLFFAPCPRFRQSMTVFAWSSAFYALTRGCAPGCKARCPVPWGQTLLP